MAKRKSIPLPQIIIRIDQPCKNGQPHVASDGSCLRCGAHQGVHGYACADTMQRDFQIEVDRLESIITSTDEPPSQEATDHA